MVVIIAAVVAVAVLVAVYPLVPLVTQAISETSPSHPVARQTVNFPPCFAAFYCFLPNGPFPGLLRPSSQSDFLRIPIQRSFFNGFTVLPHSVTDPPSFSRSNPVVLQASLRWFPAARHYLII